MESNIENYKRHFTDLKLKFPNTTFCGKYFNKIFDEGLTIREFEIYCRSIAEKVVKVQVEGCNNSTQYVFKSDVWGTKETMIINKEHLNKDFDIIIRFAIRDPREFTTVLEYIKNQWVTTTLTDQPGNKLFELSNFRTPYDKRISYISIIRGNEQSTDVVLLFKFCREYNLNPD